MLSGKAIRPYLSMTAPLRGRLPDREDRHPFVDPTARQRWRRPAKRPCARRIRDLINNVVATAKTDDVTADPMGFCSKLLADIEEALRRMGTWLPGQ